VISGIFKLAINFLASFDNKFKLLDPNERFMTDHEAYPILI
jgi:hypothetical protein